MGRKADDLTGRVFGRLTAVERVKNGANRNALWRCDCDCGGDAISYAFHLKMGHTKSCGCLSAEHMARVGRTNRKPVSAES